MRDLAINLTGLVGIVLLLLGFIWLFPSAISGRLFTFSLAGILMGTGLLLLTASMLLALGLTFMALFFAVPGVSLLLGGYLLRGEARRWRDLS